jgi:diacylglycerol kinase family enzyme
VLKRLKYLPVIEKGKHLDRDFIVHKTISNVLIDCEEGTFAQIDGELISAKTFEIKVLPGQYLFKY